MAPIVPVICTLDAVKTADNKSAAHAIMRDDSATSVAFGVDVGGSGIKAALVDLETGEFIGERKKVLTPRPSTPQAVVEAISGLAEDFGWEGPTGVTLPSVIKNQVACTAANIDDSWIGTDVQAVLSQRLPGREIAVLNDADAAGIAEVAFGEQEAREGSVIFLTFGTGIGSAFLLDGNLFPNTEIGHLSVDNKEAEHQASSAVKDREELSYKKWAQRVDRVLREYEALFNPSLFIVGGGISRKHDKWVPLLTVDTPVKPAQLRNRAGIVGAAMAVAEGIRP